MKIIYNNIIPFKGFIGINLFGILFVRSEYKDIFNKLYKDVINHELIHSAQMKEMLYIPFYLWYIIEYLIKFIKYKNLNMAYHNISFEQEAYNNELDFDYLNNRKRYNWIKYLKF